MTVVNGPGVIVLQLSEQGDIYKFYVQETSGLTLATGGMARN